MIAAIISTVAIVVMGLMTNRALRRLAQVERQNALMRAELRDAEQALRNARHFPARRKHEEISS